MSGSNNALSVADAFLATASLPRNKPKRRYTPPFSMRLSKSERDFLDKHSGTQSWAAYIRERVFGQQTEKRRKVKKPPVDSAMLALVLSELGQSRLASNINQLAKAANMGALDITPEIEKEIETACQEIQTMKMLLIAALGVVPEDDE